MRIIGLTALAVLSMLAVAATCVTGVQRRGDSGPWTGEVVNGGDQAVFGVAAVARMFDADGREVWPGRIGASACPSLLLPGEHGAFEMFDLDPSYPPEQFRLKEPTLPLSAEFDAFAHENIGTGPARSDGLLVTLLSRDDDADIAHLRLTNNHENGGSYRQFTVCGIARDAQGTVTAVGRADAPVQGLPLGLLPGESIDLDMPFYTLAADDDLRFYALGLVNAPYEDCCPLGASTWRSTDLGSFSVLLPPGWRYVPVQGIDSFVGSFEGDGVQLWFDYGAYSGLPPEADAAHSLKHDETVGGVTATLFAPEPGSSGGGAGAYFAEVPVRPSPVGPIHLVLTATGLSPAQQHVALRIFRSVRFPPAR